MARAFWFVLPVTLEKVFPLSKGVHSNLTYDVRIKQCPPRGIGVGLDGLMQAKGMEVLSKLNHRHHYCHQSHVSPCFMGSDVLFSLW